MRHEQASRVQWRGGIVGQIVDLSAKLRLQRFIENEESEAVQLFSDEARATSTSGDWYGEHVGKWLVSACLAWRRTQDPAILNSIERVIGFLITQQEEDGYLGTYAQAANCRLNEQAEGETRSWDIWVHAWMLKGLNTAFIELKNKEALRAAERIGSLILRRFEQPGDLLSIGNHAGLSSAVIIEPMAQLALLTNCVEYATFAAQVVDSMEVRGLPILSCGIDASELGTGKSYQICWILCGLVQLSRATGDSRYLSAAETWWSNIFDHHLTPMGGPWGGIGTHKEVFNAQGFFSPEGLTETCSTASWMKLCHELYMVTGEVKYVDAFERAMYNALLGAIDQNGEDWSYFTFPNGRRNSTYHWACCKSSGAMALEECANMAVTRTADGISINLLEPFAGSVLFEDQPISVSVDSDEVVVSVDAPVNFELAIRIPDWARHNSEEPFMRIKKLWSGSESVALSFQGSLKVIPRTYTLDHHGQEVVHSDFAYLSLGPYIYACGLIDGYKKSETLRIAQLFPESSFSVSPELSENGLPAILYHQPGRQPVVFRPYFQAGGRHDQAWRTTWISVAWQ